VSEEAIERLRAVPGVTSVTVEEREQAQVLLVHSPEGTELTQSLLGMLGDASVGRVAAREPTLEDAYVALVGEA
jgi:ABC-2 type transport system ATP-binding protein